MLSFYDNHTLFSIQQYAILTAPVLADSKTAILKIARFNSPDEGKSVGEASALLPVLKDFFALHLDFHLDTVLGKSALDSANLYGILINDFHFAKALIPYNPRNKSSLKEVDYNTYSYPTYSNAPSFGMKYCGITKEKDTDHMKWSCDSESPTTL